MNSLDRIVSQSIAYVLENDLGKRTYKKIEKDLKETYEISVFDAVSDFAKLDLVLRKFFGPHAVKIEMRIFKRILAVEKNNHSSITIKDQRIAKNIFESYGDPDKKRIMDILSNEPKSISSTIAESKLPQASTYRRVRELIRDGLLTLTGYAKASDGRKVNEYMTTCKSATFDVQKDNLNVNIRLENKILQNSFVYNSLSVTK